MKYTQFKTWANKTAKKQGCTVSVKMNRSGDFVARFSDGTIAMANERSRNASIEWGGSYDTPNTVNYVSCGKTI